MFGEQFSAVILAGGRGTRMQSSLTKALHPVAGSPLLQRVIKNLKDSGLQDLHLVIPDGHQALFKQVLHLEKIQIFTQKEPLGTGDALKKVNIENLKENVLVLNGDQPLIEAPFIKDFLHKFLENQSDLSVLTSYFKNPSHYGRIQRREGKIHSIIEASEALSFPGLLDIKEINVGMYFFKKKILPFYLPQITNQNSKKEYYLTDIVSICRENSQKIETISAPQNMAFGVNTQAELARATQYIFQKKIKELMNNGVIVLDPEKTYIEEQVQIADSTVLYPGCWIRGKTKIGLFCILEPNVIVVDCKIEDNVQIKAGSYLEDSTIERGSSLGPYAHLRPGNKIGQGAKIGNFVEMKKVNFGDYSKASHLSYLGDATIGEHVNIGCGTTTCNYATDKKKYETKIGDYVFVGSHAQLVAPVEVGSHSVIGSGSVITKDVPSGALSLSRIPQINKENYSSNMENMNPKTSNPSTSSSLDSKNKKPASEE